MKLRGLTLFGAIAFVAAASVFAQAETLHLVCSVTATGAQLTQNGRVDWQAEVPAGGIFVPMAMEFTIDVKNKKISFPNVAWPGGPFDVAVFDMAIQITSVKDPNIATGDVTWGIDRRTGAFLIRANSLLMQDGKLQWVGANWKAGVCGTAQNKF
jgi:hypothetical protein